MLLRSSAPFFPVTRNSREFVRLKTEPPSCHQDEERLGVCTHWPHGPSRRTIPPDHHIDQLSEITLPQAISRTPVPKEITKKTNRNARRIIGGGADTFSLLEILFASRLTSHTRCSHQPKITSPPPHSSCQERKKKPGLRSNCACILPGADHLLWRIYSRTSEDSPITFRPLSQIPGRN